jgi:hypothetical protein
MSWELVLIIPLLINTLIIAYKMQRDKVEQIEREERLRDWLFKSLYTINQGVLLPDVAPQEIKREKATIYTPENDPMREFKEGFDDYFGDKK